VFKEHHKTYSGIFWDSSSPDDKLFGTLTLNPHGTSKLAIYTSTEKPELLKKTTCLYGYVDKIKHVRLDNCDVIRSLDSLYPGEQRFTKYELDIPLVFSNTSSILESTQFSKMSIEIPELRNWTKGEICSETSRLTEYNNIDISIDLLKTDSPKLVLESEQDLPFSEFQALSVRIIALLNFALWGQISFGQIKAMQKKGLSSNIFHSTNFWGHTEHLSKIQLSPIFTLHNITTEAKPIFDNWLSAYDQIRASIVLCLSTMRKNGSYIFTEKFLSLTQAIEALYAKENQIENKSIYLKDVLKNYRETKSYVDPDIFDDKTIADINGIRAYYTHYNPIKEGLVPTDDTVLFKLKMTLECLLITLILDFIGFEKIKDIISNNCVLKKYLTKI